MNGSTMFETGAIPDARVTKGGKRRMLFLVYIVAL